jgi:hypothetical protein
MKRIFIGAALSMVLSLGVWGCNKLKVDCEKMCDKTFKECVGEVLVAAGKTDQAKLDQLTKTGKIKGVQETGYGACLKDCKNKKGFGSDAGSINKCLEIKDCKEYAKCIRKHIK